ncbi:hypothetical protein CONLIGDRAFT_656331 [Coniochaeta ligniaria NRRL 30616]|uniref:Secreted protein n=1 Tax=Coniochaeta ligniaria NRRL 30616 TaxID=1408157 RepID=A0A1J7IIM2_9PEZI|nr:hypothetical protein CONLIGDRAFT_656331 [Coniochaeta ligniaria NRRL 30616]
MKLLSPTLFLPVAAFCAPVTVSSRQAAQIQFTSITTSGPGCPQGSITTDVTADVTAFTLGFDKYQTLVGPGVDGSNREKSCDIFLSLRYPLGCTSAVINTTYHGFAQLDSGVVGTLSVAYILSPGSTTNSPPPAMFPASSWSIGEVYTKRDSVTATENIQNTNQRDVSLTIRTRIMLIVANSTMAGTLSIDDATVAITTAQGC